MTLIPPRRAPGHPPRALASGASTRARMRFSDIGCATWTSTDREHVLCNCPIAARAAPLDLGRQGDRKFSVQLSLKLSVAVLTISEPSLLAFTDEHYCGPAVTRSMHSDDTHSQMWVGSGLTSNARGPMYSNLARDSNSKNRNMSLLAAHICRGAIDVKVSLAQNVRMSLRCRLRISRPVAHAGPTAHTS